MDFSLSEEQEMMQALARDFMKDEFPEKVLRAVAAGDEDAAAGLWQKIVEMNLTGLSVPEEYGGLGDMVDLCTVLEEMGKACFISPFFTSVVLGAGAISIAGEEAQKAELLPAVAEGKIKVTLALCEERASSTPDDVNLKAVKDGDGFVLNGAKTFVPDASVADYIITAARTGPADTPESGITLFLVPAGAVTRQPMAIISGEGMSVVTYDSVRLGADAVLGPEGKGWQCLDIVLQKANVGRCATMCGLARKALDLTLEYAKERIAFGHPIGAFQSIQHRCADMLMDVEGSRFLTYHAAWKLASGQPAAREAAIAKAWVSSAARRVMHSAHQAHGAIGFSEDHILHFYTRMTRACEFSFGDPDYHYNELVKLTS